MLDPDVAALLARSAERGDPSPETMGLSGARRNFDLVSELLAGTRPAGVGVSEVVGPGGRVRFYRCAEQQAVLLYLHGGGFTVGSLDSHDRICAELALRSGFTVAALEYQLAPEHPWPAAVTNAVATAGWLTTTRPGSPLVVGGDSAGAAVAVAAAARSQVQAALLLYPCLDPSMDTASWARYGTGYWLEASTMRWFWANSGLCEPVITGDLTGMPRTHVLTLEYDPLADEARDFAAGLGAADVPVSHVHLPGLVHGSAGLLARVPAAMTVIDDAAQFLRDVLSSLT